MAKRRKKGKKKDVKSVIEPGSLRERVKRGEVEAPDVLAWLGQQEYSSERFVRWLVRRPVKPRDQSDSESLAGAGEAATTGD